MNQYEVSTCARSVDINTIQQNLMNFSSITNKIGYIGEKVINLHVLYKSDVRQMLTFSLYQKHQIPNWYLVFLGRNAGILVHRFSLFPQLFQQKHIELVASKHQQFTYQLHVMARTHYSVVISPTNQQLMPLNSVKSLVPILCSMISQFEGH